MMQSIRDNKIYKWLTTIMVFIALVFAAWITIRESSKIPWQDLRFNPWFLGLSIIVSTIGYLPAIFAWRRIIRSYGIEKGFWEDLRNYVYTMLGTLVPGGIWQVAGRSVIYKRSQQSGFNIALASLDEIIFFSLAGWFIFSLISLVFPNINPLKSPIIGIVILGIIFIATLPVCFNALHRFIFRIFKRDNTSTIIKYSFKKLSICILWELITLTIGSSAIYLLLLSFYPTTFQSLFYIAAAYCFSVSFANLFFWLPGSLILKDSSMVFALTTFMPISFAIVCVIIIRIWTIFSVLVPFFLVWIIEKIKKKSILKI